MELSSVTRTKICSKCKENKPIEEFFLVSKNKPYRQSVCKICKAKIDKDRYDKNPRPVIARSKKWTKEHKEEANGCKKKWFERHPDYKMEWQILKTKTDPVYRLVRNLRNRVAQFLKGTTRNAKTMIMVGCSGEEAMKKIEALFWPGMTTLNDGPMKWHIDHIVPLDSFDKDEANWQLKAFHWSNLQPLWEDDNLQKHTKLDWAPTKSKHPLPERLKHFATKAQNQFVHTPPS